MADHPSGSEYHDRIVQRFESQSKRFNLVFGLVITFGLVFFSFILLPYLSLAFKEYQITDQITKLESQHAVLEEALDALETQLTEIKNARNELNSRLTAAKQKHGTINENLKNITGELSGLRRQLKNKNSDVQAAKSLNDQLKESAVAVDRVLEGSEYKVAELREFLFDLQKLSEAGELRPDSQCTNPDRIEQVRCRVRAKVEFQFGVYGSRLRSNIIAGIGAVNPDVEQKLLRRLDDLKDELSASLVESPDFWRTVSDKELLYSNFEERFAELAENVRIVVRIEADLLIEEIVAGESALAELKRESGALEGKIEQFETAKTEAQHTIETIDADVGNTKTRLTEANSDVSELSLTLETVRKESKQKKEILRKKVDEIEEDRKDIEKRLETIESPMGVLPIGLEESILAFPVILAIGFWLAATILSELTRLRHAYHRLAIQTGILDPGEPRHGMMLIAPLWFDPMASRLTKGIRGLGLAVPVLLVAVAVGLIVYSWNLESEADAIDSLQRFAYLCAYLVSLIFVVTGAFQIFASYRAYSGEFQSYEQGH